MGVGFHFLATGILLGLPSGLAPGPLLALVISETLRHDIAAGIKVAMAPLLTDLPLLLVTFFILSKLAAFHAILGIISLAGGCVILFMGIQGLRSKGIALDAELKPPASMAKGILANVLSPHPYLFWFSVGGPIMIQAHQAGTGALPAFILGFYTMLVGAKISIAIMTGKSKAFLRGKAYRYALQGFGLVLCGFSLFLFHDGLVLLKII